MAAEASPLPRDERTPPVTKMNLVRLVLFGFFMVGTIAAEPAFLNRKVPGSAKIREHERRFVISNCCSIFWSAKTPGSAGESASGRLPWTFRSRNLRQRYLSHGGRGVSVFFRREL